MRLTLTILLAIYTLFFIQCDRNTNTVDEGISTLRLATTTSTQGSGLLDRLIPLFEETHKIKVEVYSFGTGKAIQMGREGSADVILVHARSAEDQFINEGYGINRRDVMYNDFVLLGPPDDPYDIESTHLISQAFNMIHNNQAPFISRGDNSGTHMRELSLWQQINVAPQGSWYRSTEKGMKDTLFAASNQLAYVLSDRSTYLHNQGELDLQIVLEGDQQLYNPYGIIAVNPTVIKDVNYQAAMKFIEFITSQEGQRIIRDFGIDEYGEPLFYPMAVP